MNNPNEAEIFQIWVEVMELAKKYEDECGYPRDVLLQGLLQGTLDLARKREDQSFFQSFNDTRRFYLLASQETQRRFDQFIDYKGQREAEKMYGKDMLYLRNAKNFGWKAADD